MANTYTEINIHAVFSVKGRECLLSKDLQERLFQYISGILKNLKQYPLAVNGSKDHVHVFFELTPSVNLSEVIKTVKTNSSKWINENKFLPGKFAWQEGYGAFSYSKSQRTNVIEYIMNQKIHHSKIYFKEEYLELLKKFEIEFEEKYIFDFFE